MEKENGWITFILSIAFPVCGAVFQDFIIRAYIAIIGFIINVFIFPEETFFRHWPFVRKQRFYSIIKKQLGNRRCLVTCIHNYHFRFLVSYLVIDSLKSSAVMQVSGTYIISQNPTIFVTSVSTDYAKTCLCSPL